MSACPLVLHCRLASCNASKVRGGGGGGEQGGTWEGKLGRKAGRALPLSVCWGVAKRQPGIQAGNLNQRAWGILELPGESSNLDETPGRTSDQ